MTNRPLRVFLCHSSNDKPAVRELYQKLRAEAWIEPWLDEEELYPGQDWETEIEKAVESSDAVLVCLSNGSINKKGYVQKELRFALDVAFEMPEETIFLIPLRLEECTPPRSLRDWHYADYFEGQRERGIERLLISLRKRAESLGIYFVEKLIQKKETDLFDQLDMLFAENQSQEIARPNNIDYQIIRNKLTLSNGMELMRVPAGKFIMGSDNGDNDEKPKHTVDIPYDYWMARFTIANEQYNEYCKVKNSMHLVSSWEKKKNHPVTRVKWTDAVEYCKWLNDLLKNELPNNLMLRLPTESEWEKAARGIDGREYTWGNIFDKNKCNSIESDNDDTTPAGLYSPQGDSPYGCADMIGNVWEWTHSLHKDYPYNAKDGREDEKNISVARVLRGGSCGSDVTDVRCARRFRLSPRRNYVVNLIGFRVVASPIVF